MKRLIITESERAKILNMHGFKKMLSEATLVDVQNLLNTKFSSGLTPDGKYGPKTAAAIEKALSGGLPVGQPEMMVKKEVTTVQEPNATPELKTSTPSSGIASNDTAENSIDPV